MARRLNAGRTAAGARPPVDCSECGVSVGPMELFPKNRCVDCHAASPEGQRMVSADELVDMWGGPARRSSSRRRTASRRTASGPTVVTEDNQTVGVGSRVFNYYDMKWGEIVRVDEDGWCSVRHEDGSTQSLDGSRMSTYDPRDTNPNWPIQGAKRNTASRRNAHRRTAQALNDIMQFDHVIEVLEDGSIVDRNDIYAPDLWVNSDGTHELWPEWELLDGHSGQYGYSGPLMHQSEVIGGGLERRIREEPGIYVALVGYPAEYYDEDGNSLEPESWAVARKVG